MSHISNTLFMGKVLLRYKTLDSTNLEAQKLLSQENQLLEGTVITADIQTNGKGQRGNTWHSPSDCNLLSSFILYPKHLLPKQQFTLNIIASLAVIDLLQDLDIENISIKWPNDIYIGKKKVAGILIQNNIASHHILSTVIGIGLNVNQTAFAPSLPNPTSLKLVSNRDFNRDLVLDRLCYFLEKRYLQAKTSDGLKAINGSYTSLLFQLNAVATYLIEGKHLAGIIRGIDPLGKLILDMEDRTRLFDFQELRFVV